MLQKKSSDFRNKMYFIFGEYKVQVSKVTPLSPVGDFITGIKVCRLYVLYLSYSNLL